MKKLTLVLGRDEMYPSYFLSKPSKSEIDHGYTIEVPNDLYNRYVKIEKAYMDIQQELKELI